MIEYKMTEEVVRWSFEVRLRESREWYVAFTNPTAGPWKTIKCLDGAGNEGEVYRFSSEEKRPDVVAVSDYDKTVLIIEAKESINNLADDQADKSVNVTAHIASELSNKQSLPFWGDRSTYKYVMAVLWGSDYDTSISYGEITNLLDKYKNKMENYDSIFQDIVIGIESSRDSNGHMRCRMYLRKYSSVPTLDIASIAQDLDVDYVLLE
jgi:hypothetical protein